MLSWTTERQVSILVGWVKKKGIQMCKADMQNKNTIDNIFRFEMCILMIDINNYQKIQVKASLS